MPKESTSTPPIAAPAERAIWKALTISAEPAS
jgi:hypothetical protein